MNEIPVRLVCRYGLVCEKVEDGAIIRCMHLTTLSGWDPVTGQPVEKKMCADLALLELIKDGNRLAGHVGASVQQLRDVVALGPKQPLLEDQS